MDQLLESLRKAREHITVQKRPWIDKLLVEAADRIEELEARLEIAATAINERVIPQAESLIAKVRAAKEILAVIHRDGGHHTECVGFEQSCVDAIVVISKERAN
jgi:hypothetical protein